MSIFSQRSRSEEGARTLRRFRRGGFTLIELLVVMSIMVIVTTILMVNQSKFDSSTLMRSLAYSVALSVRQAQVYGTSVYGTATTSTACGTNTYQGNMCFAPGYGIYVDFSNPGSYILYADLNNNGKWDSGEDVKSFSLGKGYAISKICASTLATTDCSGGAITWLSIVYRRPNPEACITTSANTGVCAVGATAVYASSTIQIQMTGAPTGSTRSIYINQTGQISVGANGT